MAEDGHRPGNRRRTDTRAANSVNLAPAVFSIKALAAKYAPSGKSNRDLLLK